MREFVKIRCTEEVTQIYKEYRPVPGKIYDAIKGKTKRKNMEFVIVKILEKWIVLRRGEYEILGV